MRIVIESIPHARQRYDTCGDWWFDPDGTLQLRVSDDVGVAGLVPGQNEQFLVALHELVEVWLCKERGITQQQVDAFDLAHLSDDEPGDHPEAPYRREHRFAMLVEHLMAHELGMTGYGVMR